MDDDENSITVNLDELADKSIISDKCAFTTSFEDWNWKALWDPQPDITVLELARIVPMFWNTHWHTLPKMMYEALPDECKRHWKVLGDEP